MLYRMRIYQAVTENLPTFNYFFRTYLLPVQLRHGARLIGRQPCQFSFHPEAGFLDGGHAGARLRLRRPARTPAYLCRA
jgi:hypothetical protein